MNGLDDAIHDNYSILKLAYRILLGKIHIHCKSLSKFTKMFPKKNLDPAKLVLELLASEVENY